MKKRTASMMGFLLGPLIAIFLYWFVEHYVEPIIGESIITIFIFPIIFGFILIGIIYFFDKESTTKSKIINLILIIVFAGIGFFAYTLAFILAFGGSFTGFIVLAVIIISILGYLIKQKLKSRK
ncbi:hypothetical protein HOD75_01790 [archaeon]|jgi:hypothetical protein|nr:hypothetical protein [archaeon]MBT4241609.1 hypothetical protein [archaeon]MBT4418004.1 hypothetical protein [archaeon]